MKSPASVVTSGKGPKPMWRSPKLQEIGNLRDFVREGNAFGKSGACADGNTSGNNEAMCK
jgi:hypothetical protein